MMVNFRRLATKVVAGTGFCIAACSLTPHASATAFKEGGYKCVDAAGAPCAAPAAPVVDAAGFAAPAAPAVPVVPAAPPIVPPVPAAPVVPVVPAAAPAPVAAPVTVMGGTGKGVPIGTPAGEGGPAAGVPTLPGPDS